jgi:hypothetical protein
VHDAAADPPSDDGGAKDVEGEDELEQAEEKEDEDEEPILEPVASGSRTKRSAQDDDEENEQDEPAAKRQKNVSVCLFYSTSLTRDFLRRRIQHELDRIHLPRLFLRKSILLQWQRKYVTVLIGNIFLH